MRLAWVGPVHPRQTGQSDHAEFLLPQLAESASIDLFLEDYLPSSPHLSASFPCYSFRELPSRASRYDCAIYQIGNNQHHAYVADLVQQVPGVLDIHDLVLSHMNSRFRPDLSWFLGTARGAVVHSRYQLHKVMALSGLPVEVIPLPKPALGFAEDDLVRACKEKLGMAPDHFLVLSTGWATPHKRLPQVIEAVAALVREGIKARYIHAGEANGELKESLLRLAREHRIQDRVKITGWLPSWQMELYIRAADMCVNLRYPTVGEVSATAIQCMGAGKPVLITPVDSLAELPTGTCIPVEPAPGEQAVLYKAMLDLYRNPEYKAALGRCAHRYVADVHDPAIVARRYLSFLQGLSAPRRAPSPPVAGFERPPLRAEGRFTRESVRCRGGSRIRFHLQIQNTGTVAWSRLPGPNFVKLTARLLSEKGEVLQPEIWTRPIEKDVPPQGVTTFTKAFRAPRGPGVYVVELDLVHQEKGRFSSMGFKPLQFRLTVAIR